MIESFYTPVLWAVQGLYVVMLAYKIEMSRGHTSIMVL
jgi:hypothetical protein